MANQAELIPFVMRVRVGDEYIPHAPLTTASQVLMPDDTTLEDYIAMTEPSELLCQIQHNLNGYPNVLLLEGRYTAGAGGAGDGPAGGEELTQYPCRQTYLFPFHVLSSPFFHCLMSLTHGSILPAIH